jgi:hypothetical protein
LRLVTNQKAPTPQTIGTWLRRLGKDNQGVKALQKAWLMRGLVAFGFHLMGETVFLVEIITPVGVCVFFWFKLAIAQGDL